MAHIRPSSPAMLPIRGVSITSNYQHHIVWAFTEPKYIQSVQEKSSWTNFITSRIAWRSLSLCELYRIGRHVLTTKICSDLLPTANRLKGGNYQNHDSCAACGQLESTEHLFLCSAPSRIKWRTCLLSALQSKLTYLKTNAKLGHVLCNAISDWFENGLVLPNNYHEKYHDAIATQSLIGW